MISYQIEGPFLHVTAEGVYSLEDVRNIYEAAASDAALPSRALLILDVGDTATTFNGLDDVAKRVGLMGPLIPKIAPFCAFVAADSEHRHLSRHGQLTTSELFGFSRRDFPYPRKRTGVAVGVVTG